jgi:thiamine pyrophosphate-dependent acetolactate synthase large subunit-like protein
MKFHEAFACALKDQGITTVFGVLGGGNLFFMDSFQRYSAGRFVSMSNELGGVLAANGYSCTTGSLGVATVTHGPGLTNTITALAEGVKDRASLLLLAGDTTVMAREHLQNISQRDLVLPTGAGFEQLRAPETLAIDLAMAIRRATIERRPVVLNIPAEFQWLDTDYVPAPRRSVPVQALRPAPSALDAAVGIIASAKRPVVVAGRGASSAEARAALLRLAQRIGAPVATTLRGKDLFDGEPHNIGICGTLSHQVAVETLGQSDCVIAFGASLNQWTTAQGAIVDKRHLVHVDLEHDAINRYSQVSEGVIGDATVVAETIVEWLDAAEIKSTGFASDGLADRLVSYEQSRLEEFENRRRSYAASEAHELSDGTVDLDTALFELQRALPSDYTLVFDGGRYMSSAWVILHISGPRALIHTTSFGSIGLGMGNAVGAALGKPERPTLLVTGDGGFMLGGLVEFNSAVRHHADLVVIVLNDSSYGSEHVLLHERDMDPSISLFDWPEFGPVATALGGHGFTVRTLDDLDVALAAIQHRARPMLIDIKLDPQKMSVQGADH